MFDRFEMNKKQANDSAFILTTWITELMSGNLFTYFLYLSTKKSGCCFIFKQNPCISILSHNTWTQRSSPVTCRPCHVHHPQHSPVALTTSVGTRPGFSRVRPVTGVSRRRWRSRSSRWSRPSVPSVTPTHRCASVSAGAPSRGWPPPGNRGSSSTENSRTHTNGDFTGSKNKPGHMRQPSFTEKMFRWKNLHQTAPAGAERQTSAPLQPRISGKTKFPKHFQGSHNMSTRSGCWDRGAVSRHRVTSGQNLPKKVEQ